MGHKIKRGITIYSWHRQVEAGKLTWEDCIEAAVKMGCNGLEPVSYTHLTLPTSYGV